MSSAKRLNERYKKLIKIINQHNLLYHTYDSPSISDLEYDELYNELKNIESENPKIITSDSPTQRVGSDLLSSFDKKKHDKPMLSLSNAASQNDFEDFYSKLLSSTRLSAINLFAEPKFDGLAVSILYENGKYINATTRGDGFIGEDVTLNVKTIKSLPLSIDNTHLPKRFSLRGEVFIDKKDFISINQELKKTNKKVYSNTRNLAAGSVRQLDPAIASSRKLRLFIHGVSDPSSFLDYKTHSKLMNHLQKIGFPINNYSKVVKNIDESYNYFDQMNSDRYKIPYDIDGLVYRIDEFQYYSKLGYTSKSPKWAIAYKFKSLEVMTQILDVTFQVGRTGTITPVAELEPVNIGGVNVSRATLHNFSEIQTKDININDFVYVKRAGDVIPDIDRVELNKRKIIKKIIPPKKCPSCNSILSKIDNQVAFKCMNNKGCTPQIEQSIIHFISRKAMNIQGIGNQIIKELISKKIIKSSADLFKLSKDDFKKLDRVGDKSINNYLSSINLSKNVMFNKFIYALGIQEVGESSSKSIAKKFNSIYEFLNCDFQTLIEINDVGPIVAKNIITYLGDKDNNGNIKNLISHGINIIYEKANKSQKLTNAVITGTFDKYSRSEIVDTLEASGYKITTSISKNTNLLICGDNPGSKFNKALDYGIKIIYEKELLKLLSKFH